MIYLYVGTAVAFLIVLWAGFSGLMQAFQTYQGVMERALIGTARGPDEEWMQRVRSLEDQVDALPAKWEAFRDQARAAEERTRGRIRRAVESIEAGEVDGFDRLASVAHEAGLGDAEGGGDAGVQPMRPTVESPPKQPEDPEDFITAVNRMKYAG